MTITSRLPLCFSLLTILALSPLLLAQTSSKLQTAALPGWTQLMRNSGLVFGGTVLSVQRDGTHDPATLPTVAITFRVDEPVRGVKQNQQLTLREWAGLWSAGERYRPGQRVFLFLYAPSKLGLTSPVWGGLGRFAVDSEGNLKIPPGVRQFEDGGPIANKLKRRERDGWISQRALAHALKTMPEDEP